MYIVLIAIVVALIVALAGLVELSVRLDSARHDVLDAERKFATRLATKEDERAALRAILDGIGEGLLAIDRKRRVLLANRRFLEMFSVPPEVVGHPLSEAIRIPAVFNACDAALCGTESSERFSLRWGVAERRIELRAMPLTSEQIAAVALFIDVTQLERLEQIRRDFISDFSHEVRTPLAGLSTAVESYELGSTAMSADDDQQLRRIMLRQLKRLQRLVDDLAELSRIEAGDLTLDLREVDLMHLLTDLAEDFADRAAQRGLHIAIAGEPIAVTADAVRLQQAFSNLIDNAIKYGGERSTIDIALRRDGNTALASVTDHGEGIAPEEKEKIFRRFYRIDKSRTQSGTGLGLAITKHLILLHGGSIDVESTPGAGATFVVRLPVR